MPKIRKKTSKRATLRKQYSVQKKVKDHHRKIKKEAKKLGKLGLRPKKAKRGPGVPNLFPHKEEMLESLERKQNLNAEMKKDLEMLKSAQKLSTNIFFLFNNFSILAFSSMLKNARY